MSHLNPFELQQRTAGESHENDLTRAFLVLLRLVPMAMSEFLVQIRERQREAGYEGESILPQLSETSESIDVVTQKGRSALDREREWLVSVLMTDENLPIEDELSERDGSAIYDGVITLEDHVVTIENKPRSSNVWMDQLNPDLPDGSRLGWPDGARAIVLPWKEMIQALVDLQDEARLDPTAAKLVEDFRRYVFEHFEYLNPYPTFAACRDSRELLMNRCRQILQEVGGEERLERDHRRSRFYLDLASDSLEPVERIDLVPGSSDGGDVEVIAGLVVAGDTVAQARAFYERLDRDSLVALAEEEAWSVRGDLRLRHMPGFKISATQADLASYLDYWMEHHDWIGEVSGMEAMRERVGQLQENGWLTGKAWKEFEQEFLQGNRDFVYICPSVEIETRWPIQEARTIDDGEGRFAASFRRRMERLLGLWNQSLPQLEPVG